MLLSYVCSIMLPLDERFNAAVEIIQKLPKDGPVSTSNDQKLKFYSLFKQATIGNVNTDRPGIFSLIERKKWDSWKSVEGLLQNEAKQRYIDALNEMFEKIAQELDINAWLDGDCDSSIRTNLAKLGK